ncbi:MAG: dihydroxyacetone kinase subunit DhaK [Pelagibacteraceae bacterium]
MKKFINKTDDFLKESLQGFGAVHSEIINVYFEPNFITRAQPTKKGKVALITGGGSGHEPMHGGYVGYGMLDAACPGFVFSAPTPDQMLAAVEKVDGGAGVLFLVTNYSGDIMNFQMASEMLQSPNETVLINDDVAVENSSFTTGRRGVAATILIEKIVGSLAEFGGSLEACKALGDKVNKNSGSMGVAFSSCTVPAAGKPTFELAADEMEFGVGIHGEPGRRRDKIKPAQQISEELLEAILEDLKPNTNEQVLLFINGLGGTPLTELYLLFDNAKQILDKKNIKVSRSLVGNYCTSLEMQGASITLTKLDEDIIKHWDSPVHTAGMRWGM